MKEIVCKICNDQGYWRSDKDIIFCRCEKGDQKQSEYTKFAGEILANKEPEN